MKKLFLCVLLLATMFLCSSASAYSVAFQNWGFNPNTGEYGLIQPIDEFTLLGLTLNNSDPVQPNQNGNFEVFSTQQVTQMQNNNIVVGSGVNNDYQITMIMSASGSYYRNNNGLNELTFNDGYLKVFIDTTMNYGTTDSSSTIFGADDGTEIASFDLLSGSGLMDYSISNPDGRTNIEFGATSLASGYWFDSNGNDLSSSSYDPLIIGLTDSNNQVIRNVESDTITEFINKTNLDWNAKDDADNFKTFLSNNGSFAPAPVPEPASLILLGSGLLALANIVRRRKLS